jgi:hypothetical protein
MHAKLPKSLYELKPLAYIAIAALVLNGAEDYVSAQAAFVALSVWALMILFMRRAFRLGLTDLATGVRDHDPLPR